MTKRVVLGILLAVVASTITASTIVVLGQGGGQRDEVPFGPAKALKPSELTKIPPGTPQADLTLPVDYGRFHIRAPGSGISELVYAPGLSPPPGVEAVRGDARTSDTLDDFRDHDLFIEPLYIPAGWQLTWAHAGTVIWDDGSHIDSEFRLRYDRPDYFYIDIARFLLAPDAQIELLEHQPSSQHAYTLGEIRGVPVVFQHQAPGERIQAILQVHFVTGDVVTLIESVAIDFDELIKIADALIAEIQESSS